MKMSQSFCMGFGGIEHNLRITKGNSTRQNGIIERRFLNENVIVDETLLGQKNYVQKLLHNTVESVVGENLKMLNEKHIRQQHPGRVRTVDDWIKSQMYTRQGKQKEVICEYIVQVGNKRTGCPYEVERDADGNILDVTGSVIPEWDTRKRAAYKNGTITESEICKKLKQVYKDFVTRFVKENPQARVICAAIHADEYGGCHMHMNVVWFSKTKNGVGYGLSHTTAMSQQYELRGIKIGNSRTDNAQNQWRKDMKLLLKKICYEHGIEKQAMGNQEKHRTIDEYKTFKSEYCDALEAKQKELQEKEAELSADIAKQEWYLLKKNYPALYKKIHSEYMLQKKKSIDRGRNA